MLKYALFCLMFPTVVFCQPKDTNPLSDTSIAVAIVTEDCYAGKSIGMYCINGMDISLQKGETVVISGIKNCKRSYSTGFANFFEIVYKKEIYFIEKAKVVTFENYYTDLENMSPTKADSFRVHALYIGEVLDKQNVDKALAFLEKCKGKGLAIIDWSFYDESDYTEGTSVKITILNPTIKTIKYIWFTFIGYNPVNDVVFDIRKKSSNIVVKAVGPVKPNESGVYDYSYVWFTDLVEKVKITNIKVQYMDGSSKVISNPKEIMISKTQYDILFKENEN